MNTLEQGTRKRDRREQERQEKIDQEKSIEKLERFGQEYYELISYILFLAYLFLVGPLFLWLTFKLITFSWI